MNVSKESLPRRIFGNINVVFFNEGHILRLRHHMSHSFLSWKKREKETKKKKRKKKWKLCLAFKCFWNSVYACLSLFLGWEKSSRSVNLVHPIYITLYGPDSPLPWSVCSHFDSGKVNEELRKKTTTRKVFFLSKFIFHESVGFVVNLHLNFCQLNPAKKREKYLSFFHCKLTVLGRIMTVLPQEKEKKKEFSLFSSEVSVRSMAFAKMLGCAGCVLYHFWLVSVPCVSGWDMVEWAEDLQEKAFAFFSAVS